MVWTGLNLLMAQNRAVVESWPPERTTIAGCLGCTLGSLGLVIKCLHKPSHAATCISYGVEVKGAQVFVYINGQSQRARGAQLAAQVALPTVPVFLDPELVRVEAQLFHARPHLVI